MSRVVDLEVLRAAAGSVVDPELPMLTVADLGILRSLQVEEDGAVAVTLTPTYLGCPAIALIRDGVASALRAAGAREVRVRTSLFPPWSPSHITPAGREKLAAAGIAPPGASGECPQCAEAGTEEVSSFGPMQCTELRRCTSCHEPFEAVKSR